MECAFQVEIDEYCQRVLTKHWPNVPKFRDVRECGAANLQPVDLICGGFPCQDVSYAGSGAGLSGGRSGLWFEMFRIICELRPNYVVVENVAALLDRGAGRVLSDLASIGFNAEWSIVSACSLGAPHMRRRLFIVANADRFNGRPRVRHSNARQDGTLQEVNSCEDSRASWKTRLENPSELYRGSDGLPFRLERNRAIGNSVVPQCAELIGRMILNATN